MPNTTDALERLRHRDPARDLTPLVLTERDLIRDRIVAHPTSAGEQRRHSTRWTRRLSWHVRIGGLLTAVVIAGGGSWAAGAWNPAALFWGSPATVFQNAINAYAASGAVPAGSPGANLITRQKVIPSSVVKATTVQIPSVGSVAFWYGKTKQGGWCAGLRLPGGSWVGEYPGDGDIGQVGCGPTDAQRNAVDPAHPIYGLTGFNNGQASIAAPDIHHLWDVYFGQVYVPGAVRVEDLTSGVSTTVQDGDLFALAEPDLSPPPPATPVFPHLVAYNAAGQIIADTGTPGHPPKYGPGATGPGATGPGTTGTGTTPVSTTTAAANATSPTTATTSTTPATTTPATTTAADQSTVSGSGG